MTVRPAAKMRPKLIPLLPLLALAACGAPDGFAPPCPKTAILADAGDLTRYDGRGQDVTDIVLDARITGLSGDCKKGKGNTVTTTLAVSFDLARGPAGAGRDLTYDYFVAVSRGDDILDKQVFRNTAEFPANVERIRIRSDDLELALPTPQGVSAAAYTVTVGFQLSPDELALNRRRGPR